MGRIRDSQAKPPPAEEAQTLEDMRLEILHELQDGGSADVPDSLIETIDELIVARNSRKAASQGEVPLPQGI